MTMSESMDCPIKCWCGVRYDGSNVEQDRIHQSHGEYDLVLDVSVLPDVNDLDAFAARAEAWLNEHEGEERSIMVRLPYSKDEAPGTYRNNLDGSLQILGFSVELTEEIAELTSAAWTHACETEPPAKR